MLTLFWSLSAALNGYLRFYMPTNIAIDLLRTPRGLKWAIPVALVATPAYLFAMSVCATLVERGGAGYLNALVLLFAWNSMKFACTVVLAPIWMLRVLRAGRSRSPVRAADPSAKWSNTSISRVLPSRDYAPTRPIEAFSSSTRWGPSGSPKDVGSAH